MTVKTIGVFRGTDAFDSLNLKSVMVTVTLTGVAMLFAAPAPLAAMRAVETPATARGNQSPPMQETPPG